MFKTKPLVHIGNHTWSHNGFNDYAGAVEEFKKCTDYIRANVPGKKDRLISYAQPGVPSGRWNITGAEEQKLCQEQGLVARPTFRDHGATYHLKNKDDMLAKAVKAVREGVCEYVIFHGVEVNDPKRGYQDFWAMKTTEYLPFFDELAAMRDRGELWIADHVSVHQYETERATAKVKKLGAGSRGYKFSVTCDADPKLYDQPLTLKVEVPKSWKNAVDGFVCVNVVPDGKPVTITPTTKSVSVAAGAAKAVKPAASQAAASAAPAAAMKKASDSSWTWCGWGGGGWFWSSAADPVDENVFYMGGDVNGIWKTVNGGCSWKFVNEGLPNYGVYSLAVAPSDRNTVYALTDAGVAMSTDGAKSWTHCRETARGALDVVSARGGSIHALAVDPKNAKTVYAGGRSGRAVKSTDGGKTWTVLDYLSARKPVEGEIAKPASGAGFGRITVAANANDWANYVRIQKFISQDGVDWGSAKSVSVKVFLPKDAPEGLAATIVVQSGGWAWKEGAMTPLKPGAWTTLDYPLTVYTNPKSVNMVHFVMRTNGKGFKGNISIDEFVVKGGAKPIILGEWDGADVEGWKVSPDNNTKSITKAFTTSKTPTVAAAGDPVATIAVSGVNPNLVLLCQQKLGLFRSVDAGKSWQHLTSAPGEARCVFWAGKTAPQTWFGAFGKNGIFVSKDDGQTWTSLNAPIDGGMGARDVVASWKDPKVIHAIVGQGFGGQIVTTRDCGKTWTKNKTFKADKTGNPTLPEDGMRTTMSGLENLGISPANPDYLHMAGNWNPCFTHDGGKTWVESCRGADITCFHDIQHLGADTYGAAMDEGSCKTETGGKTWTALYPRRWKGGVSGHHWRVLPQKLKNGRTRVICTVSPWAYNGTQPVRVLVSEDGGATFEEAKGLPAYRTHANTMWGEGHGRAISADPTNPDIVYLGIDGDPEDGHAGGGVFKSTDGGHTWAQLPNQPGSRRMMYGLCVDPSNPKRIVWGACGQTAGVYVSNDAGASWEKAPALNDWIFNVDVTKKGTVYAGGGQLWRSDDHGKTFYALTKFNGVSVCGIAVDPANENRLWCAATTWSGDAEADKTGVFESMDGGKTWTDITGDIGYRKPLVLRYNAQTKELWAAGPAAFKIKR